MKRYENMTKEEIMQIYETLDDCNTCKLRTSDDTCPPTCNRAMTCYLNEEIKVVSRWQTIKSDEDLSEMTKNFNIICEDKLCTKCKYRNECGSCFANYLLEKIEVEETK